MLFLLAATCILQSCATVFGGPITDCQTHCPRHGEPKRKIRPVALIADIITDPFIYLPIDFATGAIYKPCNHYGQFSQGFNDEYSLKGKDELYIGDGYISQNQIRGWVGPPLLTGYISEPKLNTGAAFLTYRHFLSENFAIGATLGMDNEEGDLSYGNPRLTGQEGTSGHYTVHAYSLAIEALLVYSKSEQNMVYGYLGAGTTYFDDKCMIFANAYSPVSLPSNPYDYHPVLYNFQFTPVGVRFGGNTALFFELGYGYKGIFSGGLSVRF